MKSCQGFFSNTFAGTCNNDTLFLDKEKTITSRIFYKASVVGKYNYKFYFSNNTFSTFYDGKNSRANLKGGKYNILSAKVGCFNGDYKNFGGEGLKCISFDGQPQKTVGEGEEFWSDPVLLDVQGGYLVFEWTVKGKKFPYTPDKIIPAQVLTENGFTDCNAFPQPCMVACDRPIKKKIVFLGDSITQGLETGFDGYKFWAALIGEKAVNEAGVWNIGLGHGRAQDAASCGVWLDAAESGDFINVCFGINDILQGRTVKEIQNDLLTIVKCLKEKNKKVGIFTVPPFNFEGTFENMRLEINSYIKEKLSDYTEYVFDFAGALSDPKEPYKAIYGEHPDDSGCRRAADEFLKTVGISTLLK